MCPFETKRKRYSSLPRVPRNDVGGRTKRHGADDFIHRFGDIRPKAVETAHATNDDDLARDIAELWFGDTRRSCVVVLGELGLHDAAITGHKLATIKNILETYMPPHRR